MLLLQLWDHLDVSQANADALDRISEELLPKSTHLLNHRGFTQAVTTAGNMEHMPARVWMHLFEEGAEGTRDFRSWCEAHPECV